jgi:hypothetical protein
VPDALIDACHLGSAARVATAQRWSPQARPSPPAIRSVGQVLELLAEAML